MDRLPYIDTGKHYPEKEFFLTDIAEVSYLNLNSDNDDFLYNGSIRDITANTIVVVDYSLGDILFFSKDGTPKSFFNRRGNGPGEYLIARRIFYDEIADDVFVIDINKPYIRVYSLYGKHKRDIPLPQGVMVNNDIVSFDDHSFFFYDAALEFRRAKAENNKELSVSDFLLPFYRISKEDGKVLDYLELHAPPIFMGLFRNGSPVEGLITRLTMCTEGALICNPETDSIFLYRKDHSITPVLSKTPSVATSTLMTYINNCIDVGRYQFVEIYTVRFEEGAFPFPAKYYMRDKGTGEVFHPKLLLPDYKGYDLIISPSLRNRNFENTYFFELDLLELKQAYAENRLSGKLKELVGTLKEGDNNVFVMASFK